MLGAYLLIKSLLTRCGFLAFFHSFQEEEFSRQLTDRCYTGIQTFWLFFVRLLLFIYKGIFLSSIPESYKLDLYSDQYEFSLLSSPELHDQCLCKKYTTKNLLQTNETQF